MILGLIIVPVVSLLTQKTKPQNADEVFECYNKKVTVNAADAITDK